MKLAGISLVLLLFLRSWLPDSMDFYAKKALGLPLGGYYVHPGDLALVVLSFPIVLKVYHRLPTYARMWIVGLLSSFLLDVVLGVYGLSASGWQNMLVAYLKVLGTMMGSIAILYFFPEGSAGRRRILSLSLLTFIFIGAQHLVMTFIPRPTWVHESFHVGPLSFYRTISTSGPSTSGGYVMVFLFVLWLVDYRRKNDRFPWSIGFLGVVLFASTLTRGPILVYFVSWLRTILHATRKRRRQRLLVVSIIVLCVPLVLSAFGVRTLGGYGTAGDLKRLHQVGSAWSDFVDGGRVFLGEGFGSLYFRDIHWYVLGGQDRRAFSVGATHNLNLLLLRELGMLRVLAVYAMLAVSFAAICRHSRLSGDVLALVVIILFNTETNLLFSEYNFAFWLFLFASGWGSVSVANEAMVVSRVEFMAK